MIIHFRITSKCFLTDTTRIYFLVMHVKNILFGLIFRSVSFAVTIGALKSHHISYVDMWVACSSARVELTEAYIATCFFNKIRHRYQMVFKSIMNNILKCLFLYTHISLMTISHHTSSMYICIVLSIEKYQLKSFIEWEASR